MQEVCLGVDIGGTNLRCAMVTASGEVIGRDRAATDIALGKDAFLDRLLGLLHDLKRQGDSLGNRVAAVGLGVPGLISNEGVIHSSVNLLPLVGLPIAQVVGERLGLPVVACNDANACAVGEKRFGAGRPYRSLLALTLGTGVGSGLILDDKLWTGIDGVAGEYGHATVEPSGIPCACGNRGCLEQYASASAITAAAARAVQEGRLPRREALGADAVAELARQGNSVAASIYQEAARYLGIAAATALNLLNLEAIILSGGVAESFDLLAETMRAEMRSRAFKIPGERARILKGELDDDAGVLGAAAIAFDLIPAS